VGGVGLGLVSLLLVFAGNGESGQVSSAPAGAGTPQNITVTVNVANGSINN
jgi:energy-converting hydrogenase Eha subunit B